jgi:hypothetical protein
MPRFDDDDGIEDEGHGAITPRQRGLERRHARQMQQQRAW